MRYKGIIFDFDYTLGDSSRGIIECINYALSGLGLPRAADADIKLTIGLSLPEALRQLTGIELAAESQRFEDLFIQKADEVMVDATILYAEALTALDKIKSRNILTGIVSTKYRHRIEAILKKYNALSLLDFIVGGEDVTAPKPAPEGLFKAMQHLQLNDRETLYVGDSVTDAKTAVSATVPFVAVLTGVTTLEDFSVFPNIAIVQNVKEVLDII